MKKTGKTYNRFVLLPNDHFTFTLDVKKFTVLHVTAVEYDASTIEPLSLENVTKEDLKRAIKLQNWLDKMSQYSNEVIDFLNEKEV